MVQVLATIYICMQAFAVLMAWPQIRKLYITKQSSSLSLTTWITWLLSSFVTMAYAYSTNQPIWMGSNIAWAIFYATMVILIIRYRKQTVYEQVVNLFRMRFYLAIRRAPAAEKPEHAGFFSKFRRRSQSYSQCANRTLPV